MTWTRAWLYVAVWLLLTVGWLATEGSDLGCGSPAETVVRGSPFGDLRPADIAEVEIETAAGRIRVERSPDGWRVVEPGERAAPADLIAALLSAVLEVGEAEVLSNANERDGDFGFDAPSARLALRGQGGAPLRIVLGSRNPAGTAIYARAEGKHEVVLLGLNLPYYLKLAIE
jgi:hypothetical protein